MPNKNYVRGRRKEYRICDSLKKEGYDIVQRTAGSHSEIDIIAIDRKTQTIKFIQSKPKNFNANAILERMYWLNGAFNVKFELR